MGHLPGPATERASDELRDRRGSGDLLWLGWKTAADVARVVLAAQGRDEARTYPWGEDAPTCELAVFQESPPSVASDGTQSVVRGCGAGTTWATGAKPGGASRDGVLDMSGNVAEWATTWRRRHGVLMGGSWAFPQRQALRAADSGMKLKLRARSSVLAIAGFRCASDVG